MSKNKENSNAMIWLKENTAFVIAVLFILLCFGLMNTVVSVINNTLLYVTDFGRHFCLDWLFIVITILCGFCIVKYWLKAKRIVSPLFAGTLLVLCVLYAKFRLFDEITYSFTCYWDGPIAYLDGIVLAGLVLVIYYIIQQVQRCKKRLEENDTETKSSNFSFDQDAPIDNSDDDLFNMGNLVKRIASYIAFTNVSKKAFSIGIVGEWGDGKTSLMNLVEEEIKREYSNFVVVHFNPRGSKKADFIQEDFLEALKQSLSPLHSGINRTINKYAVTLDVIPGIPSFVTNLLSILQIHIDKNSQSTRAVLKAAIKEIDKRIVVFIDDLDRLTGEELIEVMKVLDTNGAFPNMVFVTSYDKNYVNTVLNNYLKLGPQKRPYTDKYFTVEIGIPIHPAFRLMNQLVKLLKEACDKDFIKAKVIDVETLEKQTLQLTQYLKPRLLTIRDIKRFANQFLYDYAEIQRDVNYQDFLLLEIIKYAYPDEYEGIYRLDYVHRGTMSFTTTASADLYYLNDSLLEKKKQSGDGFEEPKIKPKCIDILRHLFPEESSYQNWYAARHLRIFSISSFDHYFYNYEFSHLKTDNIETLFATNTLKEACDLIDSWMPFIKDMETYLLTRSVESIHSKVVLRKYFQFLLYTGYKQPSINYIGYNYSFLRKEDVGTIIKNCGFTDLDEYLTWLKESLEELFAINPIIPSSFVCTPIQGLSKPDSEPDLFVVSVDYLQNYALELLKKYLNKIDEEGWETSTAYSMAQIPYDMTEEILPAALDALHDSIVAHFNRYSSSLPLLYKQGDTCLVGFNSIVVHGAFKDKTELDQIINSDKNNTVNDIQLIRAIWPLFKANDYFNITLPDGAEVETVKQTLLKEALEYLERYNQVDAKLNEIAEDWNKGHKIATINSFIERTNEVYKELVVIQLRLKVAEKYKLDITDMLNNFREYAQSARLLDAKTLRVGDFVKMKNEIFEKKLDEQPEEMMYRDNIFTVDSISSDGQIKTKEFNSFLGFDDIEAILINGIEDSAIYYDPVVMAPIVQPGQPVPVHHTDYSYFMESFEKWKDGETTFKQMVEDKGFQFVHEVQHWLMDEMQDNGLKVQHTFN